MTKVQPLPSSALYQRCNPDQFNFQSTAELENLFEIIGQPRAIEAISFGVGIKHEGFNIFALGPSGAGKRSLVSRYFEQQAKTDATPSDWCYVHNFEQSHKPRAINLPAGRGVEFRRDMEQLVDELRSTLTAAFESDEYRARRQLLEEEFREKQAKAFEEIQHKAAAVGLSLLRTPSGVVFAPMKDGEVMPPEEFQKLPKEERQLTEKNVEVLQEELSNILQTIPTWQREIRKRVTELNKEISGYAVGSLLEDIYQKYVDFPAIQEYLQAVKKDVIENVKDFLATEEGQSEEAEGALDAMLARTRRGQAPLRRYKINLLVDHHDTQGAPVIHLDNPTHQNLIGSVEHMAEMGALVTDFNLIKPGALHKANGGYLILDARKILQQPFSWEALKRALQSREIHIESIAQMLSLITTVSLEPEPIPLNIKVALLGDRQLYYLLAALDPDFSELFKVQVDFDEIMPNNPEIQHLYAQLIGTLARKNNLRPFDRYAVAKVIEHSARLVGDSEKLTAQINDIADLLREADYWASQNGNHTITEGDVHKAIDAQIYRADRVRERFHENILRKTILIDTTGTRVGQINGLSVIQLGNNSFGTPSRITARVRMGKGELVNIEREVELSGPIHSKGVLILAGFLGARYAAEQPLSLSASLVFEQSYSGVEGDSASLAELSALLSAIAEVPIKQSLAVTGSVNQHGEAQAIGGVNEKIEGFFDICKKQGLTGNQGVIIPSSNIKNLMLRQDVIEAVKVSKFHIFPIENVDQGIEILTGMPAGELDENGNYPSETINGRVQVRLARLAKKSKVPGSSEEEPKT